MKWPFVGRLKYERIVSKLINREVRLDIEINRLNQELANEINSHKETKEKFIKAKAIIEYWQKRCLNIEKELEETRDALK